MPNRMKHNSYFPLDIQISARAWNELGLSTEILASPPPSRIYPLRLIIQSLQRRSPGRAMSAGELNVLSLLNRVFRHVIDRYMNLRGVAIGLEEVVVGGERSGHILRPSLEAFVSLFPPADVWLGEPAGQFLAGSEGAENRRETLGELFLLATQRANPAAAPYADLFDDDELNRQARYREALSAFDQKLQGEGAFGLFEGSLLELLQAPLRAAPHSLSEQLNFVQKTWGTILPHDLLQGILTARDIVQEEQQMRGGGPGPLPVPRFGRFDFHYEEPERFSPDADWMSNVVLIAKTIYVWLDQLSKRYGRSITRLDQIPDEELDDLARWGYNGLWLIGIWERSPASQKIKQIMGNPEAVSSAYSLYDYVVSQDLGGEEGIADLEARCQRRGIRLGCDVVPNHTGIYSKWVKEHPDWFVQVDQPPYPSYSYTQHNLSYDGDISLFVEDGYWNHSDAAVVFKYVNNHSGETRYIYHGNDGTHLPWNDTAQLNFLLPQVREAMIQTILNVARRYKIIRFDAAMTLAKKHYQRLWFPQPGGGAGVPSRAEHAMSREDFDRAFPVEFWREVVDRVAAEVPDTLLLAEAFWLMEGYFVRTLGMHRVYNSAFMNMMKTEDNAKYRSVIKNILDFNPEILKRFVNFMNNPDEATAVEQFGFGEKYFGVAMMLVTMPGLPMFGHGQHEGLREKYGMEYRKAYWDEKVDQAMLHHHEQQIFPLMRRRWLFSGSENFVLYDFWSGDSVNEDVFAYSNRAWDQRALIVYHNRHGDTSGWVKSSCAKKVRNDAGEEAIVHPELGEALQLNGSDRHYYRFRDFRTGLEYLRSGRQLVEQGLFLELGPYQYYIFLNFLEIHDEDGSWGWLCHTLQGRAVPSLDDEWKKIRYAPLLESFRQSARPGLFRNVCEALALPPEEWEEEKSRQTLTRSARTFYIALKESAELPGDPEEAAKRLSQDFSDLRRIVDLQGEDEKAKDALEALQKGLPGPKAETCRDQALRVLFPWLMLRHALELDSPLAAGAKAGPWLEEMLLLPTLQEILGHEDAPPFNLPAGEAAAEALLVELMVRHPLPLEAQDLPEAFRIVLQDESVQTYLGCNWYEDVQYFNRERLETLGYWLFVAGAIQASGLLEEKEELTRYISDLYDFALDCRKRAEKAGYRFQVFAGTATEKTSQEKIKPR